MSAPRGVDSNQRRAARASRPDPNATMYQGDPFAAYPSLNTANSPATAVRPTAPPPSYDSSAGSATVIQTSVNAAPTRPSPTRPAPAPTSPPRQTAVAPARPSAAPANRNTSPPPRVPPPAAKADEVRRIRELEAANMNSDAARNAAREKGKDKRIVPARGGVRAPGPNSVDQMYPISVDWSNKRVSGSIVSMLFWVYVLSVLGCLIYASVANDASLPNMTALTPADAGNSTTYNNKTINITADNTTKNSTTGEVIMPVLVQELLSLAPAPIIICPDWTDSEDIDLQTAIMDFNTTDSVTTQNDKPVWGTSCAVNNTRMSYCVRPETCVKINKASNTTWNSTTWGVCTTPIGPRRYDIHWITETFLETINTNSDNIWSPVTVCFFTTLLWLIITMYKPTISPILLSGFGLVGLLIVYGIWYGGSIEGSGGVKQIASTNSYWVLIYGLFCVAFVVATFKHQLRVGKILRIGMLILSGKDQEVVPVPVVSREDGSPIIRSPLLITIFGSLTAKLHSLISLGLMYFIGTVPRVTDYSATSVVAETHYPNGLRWAQYAKGILSSLSLGAVNSTAISVTTESTWSTSMDCMFSDLANFAAAIILLSLVYVLACAYTEYAARYIVSAGVCDWYFLGTVNYRPPQGGPRQVGWIAFKRALSSVGDKILSLGLWSHLGTAGTTILSGKFQDFMVHLMVSPVETLVFDFVAVLCSAFTEKITRFSIIHTSMRPGKLPTTDVVNKLSHGLVRRVYGTKFARPGDSPEYRLLALCGSILAVTCGLLTWIWTDSIQSYDSLEYLSGYALLVMWLGGSAIQRPGFIFAFTVILDSFVPWTELIDVEAHMVKNSIVGFVLVSAVCQSIIRVFIQIPTSATDAVVYCYAIETNRRRRIRSIELDEMIHVDYLGDSKLIPPGFRLERIAINAPMNIKPKQKLIIQVEGASYEITAPLGVKPGKDFEVAIPIQVNQIDQDDDYNESATVDDNADFDASVYSTENINAVTGPYGSILKEGDDTDPNVQMMPSSGSAIPNK